VSQVGGISGRRYFDGLFFDILYFLTDFISIDVILTNAILAEIYVDIHVIMLCIHIHLRAKILCVMKYDFALNITVFTYG